MTAAALPRERLAELLAGWKQGSGEHWGREVRNAEGNGVAWCGGFPVEDAHAIAHFIAAAPDLLAACRRAEQWLEGWGSAEPYLTEIRAAIAKAAGATQ